MELTIVILLIVGGGLTLIGVLPLIFNYPFNDLTPNSGPDNLWELILIISYEGKPLYLIVGVGILLILLLLIFKNKKTKK